MKFINDEANVKVWKPKEINENQQPVLRDFGKDQEVEENLTIFLVDLESSKC
jgi:hypothetical protein